MIMTTLLTTTNSMMTLLIDDGDEAIQFVENGNNNSTAIATATATATTNPTRMTMTTPTTKQHIQHFIQPNYSIILFEYLFRSSVLPELRYDVIYITSRRIEPHHDEDDDDDDRLGIVFVHLNIIIMSTAL